MSSADTFSYTVGANTNNRYSVEATSLAYVSDQSDFSNILFESAVITGPNENTGNAQRWRGADYTVSPTSSGTYQTLYFAVEMSMSNNTGNGTKELMVGEIGFDGNVIAIPEPSSTALLGVSGLGLLLRRKK